MRDGRSLPDMGKVLAGELHPCEKEIRRREKPTDEKEHGKKTPCPDGNAD